MKPIYLVEAVVRYEGSNVIRVYEDVEDAEAFAAACTEYDKKFPWWEDPCGGNDGGKWAKNHPAGPNPDAGIDFYHVIEVNLYPTTKKEEK